MIKLFKEQLKEERIEQEILVIPTIFEVAKTTYTRFEGTVQVIEKFAYRDYTEIKRFTYYLRRMDKYWIIYNYQIQNLGTE